MLLALMVSEDLAKKIQEIIFKIGNIKQMQPCMKPTELLALVKVQVYLYQADVQEMEIKNLLMFPSKKNMEKGH